MPKFKTIEGNICDLDKERFFPGRISIENGKISKIERINKEFKNYILPGFIDSHCHVECSFLPPPSYGALALSYGTVAIVADCHEVANVLGEKGINWMIRAGKSIPFKFFWALPSCVPATPFETIPYGIGVKETNRLLRKKEFVALGEMMNYPGVINGDKDVLAKIGIAKKLGKPVDGHCPGVTGKDLKKYVGAGISTDHECVSLKEAKEKQKLGMIIQVREGSSAKNLKDLIGLDYERCCLVTDDLEVKDLIRGHLNEVLKKAVKLGVPFFKAVKMVTKIPTRHYGLNFGEVKKGLEANLVEFNNLSDFKPKRVWIGGQLFFGDAKILFPFKKLSMETAIKVKEKSERDFEIKNIKVGDKTEAIGIIPNQIVTEQKIVKFGEKDVLKIAVINRYGKEYIGLGLVKGFGLRYGALASSVAHDSHNLICIGANDRDMAKAVNLLRKNGGFAFVSGNKSFHVKLPLAGLMSSELPKKLSKDIEILEKAIKEAGCKLKNPISQISFLALLVIPELKISDRGLFDVKKFGFI